MKKLQTVGDRIRYLRKTRRPGVAQAVVAEEIGLSRSYLSGIETGTEDPGRDKLLLIADTLRGSLDWIEGRLDKVDMPEIGQFVKDPDKLALLAFWKALDDAQRELFVSLLRHPPRRDVG